MVQGGLTLGIGCGDKDDDPTIGTGGSSSTPPGSDGGSGDGGSGDGGAVVESRIATLTCTSSDEVAAAIVAEGSEETECRCIVTSTDDHTYSISHMVVRMEIPDADEDTCNDFPYWRPFAVAVAPPWDGFSPVASTSALIESDCVGERKGWHSADIGSVATDAVVLSDGDYDLRFRQAGDLTDCDLVGDSAVALDIYGERIEEGPDVPMLDSAAATPILLPENPLDVDEDDMACTASATASTTMQLVSFPGWSHPVPVAVGGERQHLFSELTAVSVSDWGDADELWLVAQDGSSVDLTTTTSSASLSGGVWPMGGVTWLASSSTESGAFAYPKLSLTHACPSSFGSARRQVDQAYALDLATLDAALDDATGGTGLGTLMTVASDTDWPVLLVRVYPIQGAPSGLGHTHVLDFELQGSRVHTMMPMTQTSLGRWDLDYDGGDWELHGDVARNPGTLTLDLDSGIVTTQTGTLQLTPTTLHLPVYPAAQ